VILNFGGQGKRRSVSQRIGAKGELLFKKWALDQSLVANECPNDFGVDFFCQVMSPPTGKYQIEETSGALLAAQVRATAGASRPRIKISKSDAEAALRLESPYTIIGIDLANEKVYYKFLDIEFAEQLAEFIRSKKNTLALRLDSAGFSSDNFRSAVDLHANPGAQQRLRIYCTQLSVQRDIPGARLRIINDAKAGMAIVEVPWISAMFSVPKGHEDIFRRLVFEQGKLPEPGAGGISIQPALFTVPRMAGTQQMVVEGLFERDVAVTIQCSDARAQSTFHVRTAGDEIALISECGLVLTWSKTRSEPSGTAVHAMSFTFSQEYGRSVNTFGQFDEWIRLLKPGAKISFGKNRSAMEVRSWGPALEQLGNAYEQILAAYGFAGIPLDDVYLTDLQNPEFTRSIYVLANFSKGATLQQLMPRVLVGPAASDPEYERKLELRAFKAPLVLNLKNRGIVLWVDGEARVYIDEDDRICGFFPHSQSGSQVEVRPSIFQKSNTPEVWLFPHWPEVKLLEKSYGSFTWKNTYNHPVSGSVWPLNSEATPAS